MENTSIKTRKLLTLRKPVSRDLKKSIDEVDILRMAYEIYLENSHIYADEMNDLIRTIKEPKVSGNVVPTIINSIPAKRSIQL